MAETEQPPVNCPYCGSKRTRLSHRQSERRPVEIYRCTSCKRHFEMAVTTEAKPFPLGIVVIGVLAVIAIATIVTVSMGGFERESSGGIPIPKPIDTQAPAPVAGTDMASQYQRGLHFWTAGNYPEAFPLLKSSADMGHKEAHYYLGFAYLYGRGTVQNYRLAFEQMQLSARQNYFDAQHQLGVMYRDGVGTPVNREQAYIWLNIAASHGHETATHDRDKMAAVMSADEIARAQDGTMKQINNLQAVVEPEAKARSSTPAAPLTPAVKAIHSP
jgi:DNA-directed RNA polymerase subunit RPC12/RpoP